MREGKTKLACRVVLEDERPPRPTDSNKLGITDKIWEILRMCWEKDPSARPQIDTVSTYLKKAVKTWVVDVPAFTAAWEAGEEQAMDLEEGQIKDLINKYDKVRYCGV